MGPDMDYHVVVGMIVVVLLQNGHCKKFRIEDWKDDIQGLNLNSWFIFILDSSTKHFYIHFKLWNMQVVSSEY